MTDNEIIKALECCCVSECDECPYDEQTACVEIMKDGALALVNSQKAEIERLECHKNEVIENCQMVMKSTEEHYNKLFEEAKEIVKSEAIKEYKEKVKAILMDKGIYPVLVKNALNEAEKEMVGDTDEQHT